MHAHIKAILKVDYKIPMQIETSIIIRTRNEEKWLGKVLETLFKQTYKNFEVIIVDSESTDRTLEIAQKFPIKIYEIPHKDFSYPHALNYGIERSNTARYIVIISGHSVPISETWLEDGLRNFSRYENILGVYGFLRPLPCASFWDRIFISGSHLLRGFRYGSWKKKYFVNKAGMGVMGFTNAIILKKLWNKRHFNEAYGLGGEDGEWVSYWFKQGYRAVRDEKFTVMHSHSLGLMGWYKQFKYWSSSKNPQPFRPLPYRKDATHSK